MITTVDKYKDSIFIRFNEGGDTYKNISKLPHYNQWKKILNHLKNRGFTIKVQKYHIDTNWGQSSHKVAYKNNVALCLELMNSQIKIAFGDVKNLWEDETNFWSLTGNRSTSLTYLEGKKLN